MSATNATFIVQQFTGVSSWFGEVVDGLYPFFIGIAIIGLAIVVIPWGIRLFKKFINRAG